MVHDSPLSRNVIIVIYYISVFSIIGYVLEARSVVKHKVVIILVAFLLLHAILLVMEMKTTMSDLLGMLKNMPPDFMSLLHSK